MPAPAYQRPVLAGLLLAGLAAAGCQPIFRKVVDRDAAAVTAFLERNAKNPVNVFDTGKSYTMEQVQEYQDYQQHYLADDGRYVGPATIRQRIASGYYREKGQPEWLTPNAEDWTHEALREELKAGAESVGGSPADIQKALRLFDAHPDWHPEHAWMVARGRVDYGMSQEQVLASWGKPTLRKTYKDFEGWWYRLKDGGWDFLAFTRGGRLFFALFADDGD